MSWFKNLFGDKKGTKKIDVGNGISSDEQGNISGELEMSVSLNDKKTSYRIPVNTSVGKIDRWVKEQQIKREEAERNKANLNSCEREPNQDEVKIPINEIDEYTRALPCKHPLGKYLFESKLETIHTGYNNILISKQDYETIEYHLNRMKRTYSLLEQAIKYEQGGELDLAIDAYQEVIEIGYDGVGYSIERPHHRLVILYRKKKDTDGEIKAAEKAINTLSAFNERMAQAAITESPNKKDEIERALPLCEQVKKDDGFLCFNPYDVIFYTQRLEKLLAKKK